MASWSQACMVDEEGRAELPPSWAQGRAVFGGLVAGLGVEALARQVPAERALRSVLVQFVGPVAPGPVEVATRVLRAGRALTQAEARIRQGGQDQAVILAAYGASRRTRLPPVPGQPAPAWPAPETLPPFPYIEGVTPTFTRHLEYRWTSDSLPFAGCEVGEVRSWVRLRDPAPVRAAGLLALADAFPAPMLALLDRPAPASTVTWMVDVLAPLPAMGVDPAGWWRFASRTVAAADGHADIDGLLWAPDGQLIATSRQLVVEFS